jgi:ribose transport system substrate-binding protein
MLKHLLVPAAMVAGLVGVGAPAQADDMKVVIGVSIPSADHGWTGGLNYHAKLAAEDAEKRFPGLKVIVKAAADEGSQANDLEDLATVQKVNGLVVLPTNGDPLTAPIAEFKKKTGAFITVVDRGLTDKSIQDLYVAGDNPGMGRSAADFFQPVRQLEPRRRLQGHAGLPHPLQAYRRGVGPR